MPEARSFIAYYNKIKTFWTFKVTRYTILWRKESSRSENAVGKGRVPREGLIFLFSYKILLQGGTDFKDKTFITKL